MSIVVDSPAVDEEFAICTVELVDVVVDDAWSASQSNTAVEINL